MKYCIYCGHPLEDQQLYCDRCGGKVECSEEACFSQSPIMEGEHPAEQVSVRHFYRSLCESSMARFFIVFAILQFVVGIFLAIFPAQLLGVDLQQMEDAFNVDAFFRAYRVTSFISMIPSVLILIGILMTDAQLRRQSNLDSCKGMRMLLVIFKVMRILYPVLLGLLSILLISGCSQISHYFYEQVPTVVIGGGVSEELLDENMFTAIRVFLGLMVLILWGACVFSVIYYHKLIRTVSSITTSIEQDRPCAEISMFVVVISFIAAGSSFSGILGSGLFGLIVSGASAGMQLLAAFLLLSVRKHASTNVKKKLRVGIAPHPGSWHCSCGRVNDPRVHRCNCGYERPAAKQLPDPENKWICENCNHTNFTDVRVCRYCGATKIDAILANTVSPENWHCVCGNDNPAYVTTCSCGRSKY